MEKITQGHPLSQSPDLVKENIETLKALFPTIVKEGKIDIEELKALLGDEQETGDEYYRFTWAGKAMARREANKPSTATLRPNKKDSKDWDTTQNIFIEGDNLEVLKLLQKSYANQIKMIYIDPPYNTGKDFVYRDNYKDNLSNYLSITGQVDEAGKKLSTNAESDGRYHSNWLNMMYPRLKLARNLLRDDGAIFISIDNKEINNLQKLCNEIFGEENFVGQISVINNLKGRNDKKNIAQCHEYLLIYQKHNFTSNGLPLTAEQLKAFKYVDENDEKYALRDLRKRGGPDKRADRPNMYFAIYYNQTTNQCSLEKVNETDIAIYPLRGDLSDGCWRWGKDTVKKNLKILQAKFSEKKHRWDVEHRVYLNPNVTPDIDEDEELLDVDLLNDSLADVEEMEEVSRTSKSKSFWIGGELSSDAGSRSFKELFDSKIDFSYPKAIDFLKRCLYMGLSNNQIVLDFFAGSAGIAQALFEVNAEGEGNRKFICVQLPELLKVKDTALKEGYRTIADISKERIRRAGVKVKSEIKTDIFTKSNNTLDIGFRAFKLDSSNIKAWDGDPESLEENLFNTESNVKEDRTEEDVLYEILLKYGLDLTIAIEQRKIAGKLVFNIGSGALFICLATDVTTTVADGIGKWKQEQEPASCRVIFRDNGFTDVEKTNSIQILKRYGIEEVNSI